MSGRKTALITGITGQDGSYLLDFLLEKGYNVRGIVRRSSNPSTGRINKSLDKYGHDESDNSRFYLRYADLGDSVSLRNSLEEFQPDEIYNLGAQSHVAISFPDPISTMEYNALGPMRILEAIKEMKLNTKFYQASSSEMFGLSPPPQNEETPFRPQSPYGISKVAAFNTTKLHREAYGTFASNGILFNHESPRRGINFVTRKITRGLANILLGDLDKLTLGNLDAKRDWGFSGEYVQAMWMILQHNKPDDFVISTGETHTVRDFLNETFSLVGLNYKDFLTTNIKRYGRPAEVPALLGDSSKAKDILGWSPKVKFKELSKMMVASDIKDVFEKEGVIPIEKNTKSDDYYLNLGREKASTIKR